MNEHPERFPKAGDAVEFLTLLGVRRGIINAIHLDTDPVMADVAVFAEPGDPTEPVTIYHNAPQGDAPLRNVWRVPGGTP